MELNLTNPTFLDGRREEPQLSQDSLNSEHIHIPGHIAGAFNKSYVFFLVLNATLGSLYFGYVQAAFNPVSHFISEYAFGKDFSPLVINLITSISPLGAALGSVTAGKTAALIGRRTLMIIIDVISIIGTVLTVLPYESSLLVGRFIQGYCIGINSCVVPLYIREVAPLEIAGSLGTRTQLLISSGVLLAPIIGVGMPTGDNISPDNQYFRVVLGVAGIPPLLRLLFTLTLFKFETPKYLVMKNRVEEAVKALSRIYEQRRAQHELIVLRAGKEVLAKSGEVTFKEIFSSRHRRRLIIGVLASVFQQFSGINAIVFFSNQIFSRDVSPTSMTPTIYTIIMGLIQVIMNLFSGVLIERFGRRKLSLLGMGFVTILLGVFGTVSLVVPNSPALKFLIWGYMIGFGLSVGPLPWIIITDILPDVAVGIAVLANWVCVFVIGLGFPFVENEIQSGWSFLIFAVTSFIGTLFVFLFMTETKGKIYH